MSRPAAVLVTVLVIVGLAGYAWIAHVLTVRDDRSSTGYLFSLASMYALVVGLGWASRWRLRVALIATVVAIAAWVVHRAVPWDPRWVYLVQHAGPNACLGIFFGRTLLDGQRPLVTRFAQAVHGELPAGMPAYTRSVTLAWTLYFALMAGCSLLLFALGQAYWWSVLANFLTLPAVALMFVGEYLVRRWRFPDFKHASLLEGIRAFSRTR